MSGFIIKGMKDMNFDAKQMQWTRPPEKYTVAEDKVEIVTEPHTDLWQRT